MENLSQPKATLTVKVMEHGTIVGTDDPICLEFEDCVNAVDGLVHWMATILAEVNDADAEKIGSDILIAALNQWTFDEHIDDEDDLDDLPGLDPGTVN
jgi:hypothetical protein